MARKQNKRGLRDIRGREQEVGDDYKRLATELIYYRLAQTGRTVYDADMMYEYAVFYAEEYLRCKSILAEANDLLALREKRIKELEGRIHEKTTGTVTA